MHAAILVRMRMHVWTFYRFRRARERERKREKEKGRGYGILVQDKHRKLRFVPVFCTFSAWNSYGRDDCISGSPALLDMTEVRKIGTLENANIGLCE